MAVETQIVVLLDEHRVVLCLVREVLERRVVRAHGGEPGVRAGHPHHRIRGQDGRGRSIADRSVADELARFSAVFVTLLADGVVSRLLRRTRIGHQEAAVPARVDVRGPVVRQARVGHPAERAEKEAEGAEQHFSRVVQNKELPDDIEEYSITESITISQLMVASGLSASRSEAVRMIRQNAVTIDGDKITDANMDVPGGVIIKVGKRRYLKTIKP